MPRARARRRRATAAAAPAAAVAACARHGTAATRARGAARGGGGRDARGGGALAPPEPPAERAAGAAGGGAGGARAVGGGGAAAREGDADDACAAPRRAAQPARRRVHACTASTRRLSSRRRAVRPRAVGAVGVAPALDAPPRGATRSADNTGAGSENCRRTRRTRSRRRRRDAPCGRWRSVALRQPDRRGVVARAVPRPARRVRGGVGSGGCRRGAGGAVEFDDSTACKEANARPSNAITSVARCITCRTPRMQWTERKVSVAICQRELPRDGAPRAAPRRPRLRAGASRRRASASSRRLASPHRRWRRPRARARHRRDCAAKSADGMFEGCRRRGCRTSTAPAASAACRSTRATST